jgi:hypothetical protein
MLGKQGDTVQQVWRAARAVMDMDLFIIHLNVWASRVPHCDKSTCQAGC